MPLRNNNQCLFLNLFKASSNQSGRGLSVVAVFLNQCPLIANVSHLPSSAQVLDLSWLSVFAVTITVEPSLVDKNQIINQDTKADLPIPPEAIACLNIS